MRCVFLSVAIALCAGGPAAAQVTINLGALEALPSGAPAVRPPSAHRPAPAHRASRPARAGGHHRVARGRVLPLPPVPPVMVEAIADGAHGSAAAIPPPAAPARGGESKLSHAGVGGGVEATASQPLSKPPAAPPPAPAVVAPPVLAANAPPLPAAAPPAPSLAAAAVPPPPVGKLAAEVSFAPGQVSLSVPAAASLAALGHEAAASPTASVNVLAYAPADPSDPSSARRASLERALSVRGALMGAGVASSRIYLRALGAPAAGSPDRADVTVLGVNAAPGTSEEKQQ